MNTKFKIIAINETTAVVLTGDGTGVEVSNGMIGRMVFQNTLEGYKKILRKGMSAQELKEEEPFLSETVAPSGETLVFHDAGKSIPLDACIAAIQDTVNGVPAATVEEKYGDVFDDNPDLLAGLKAYHLNIMGARGGNLPITGINPQNPKNKGRGDGSQNARG